MQTSILKGLSRLEVIMDYYEYLALLRELYHMVLIASHQCEKKENLQQRISQFEKACSLPPYLSALPLKQLLWELEDAQYLYPISSREITFSSFS